MTIWLAIAALTAESLGANAFFNGLTFFDDAHLLFASVAQKFDCSKNARRACSNDTNVVFFHILPYFSAVRRRYCLLILQLSF